MHLAIVIPVYKVRFLAMTLDAILSQTDKRFRVYICDDASPDNVKALAYSYADSMDFVYHRFARNLGRRDLVAHWERCIALTDESWIWLFCDDDVMDPHCVESFYAHRMQTDGQYDLYRFNTCRIDTDGNIIYTAPKHPPHETSLEFISDKLNFQRDSFVSEYIFSRTVYEGKSGFVNFPLAWCADDATWVNFGEDKGLCTIPDAYVYWRVSESNISMGGRDYHKAKFMALVAYINWLNDFLVSEKHVDEKLEQRFMAAQKNWFLAHLGLLAPFGLKSYLAPPQFPRVFAITGALSKAIILMKFDFCYWLNKVKKYFYSRINNSVPSRSERQES